VKDPQNTVEEARAPEDEAPARESFWALVPRRELYKAAVMLMVLAAVIVLRLRAAPLAETINRTFFPRSAPTVRMAVPLKAAGHE
jgi:hypothetical protein